MTIHRNELRSLVSTALGIAISMTLATAHQRAVADAVGLPSSRPATALAVFNCADSGTGSLRAAVASAVSGDTIDLTQLSCSTISLTTGSIIVNVNDLSIIGSSRGPETITNASDPGIQNRRIFTHYGSGTLQLSSLVLSDGHVFASGGCVKSQGNVSLVSTIVGGCTARDRGGGVYAVGNIRLQSSTISVSTVSSPDGSIGGGAYAHGNLYARDSNFIRNSAQSVAGGRAAFGGGLYINGDADIERSSIFNNTAGGGTAPGNVGGAVIYGSARIVNTLIASNRANGKIGGIYVGGPLTTIHNSTIVLNYAAVSSFGGPEYAAGAYLYDTSLDLRSTIIANNTSVQATCST